MKFIKLQTADGSTIMVRVAAIYWYGQVKGSIGEVVLTLDNGTLRVKATLQEIQDKIEEAEL